MKHAAIYGNGTGFMRLPHDYQYDDAKPHEVMEADVLFGEMPTDNRFLDPQFTMIDGYTWFAMNDSFSAWADAKSVPNGFSITRRRTPRVSSASPAAPSRATACS